MKLLKFSKSILYIIIKYHVNKILISSIFFVMYYTKMSRSEFVHPLSGGRNFAPKSNNDYAMPFYDQSSMYGYQTMQPNRASQFRPSSQMGERSIDGTSVKSYNAVEGSLRDSMVSFNSGFSGPSRKS
jgi:hypothetical protein